jgi:Flp pilus assembly protein TadD
MKMRVSLVVAALVLGKAAFAQSVDDGKRFLYYQRYQSAKDAFTKALAAKPNDGETTYWLGQAEIGLKDSAGAKDLYQKALQANGNDPWLLVGMGEIGLKENQTADAKNRFETAINISKGKDAGILLAVARANIDAWSGDANYAVEKLNQAMEKEKKHVEASLYVSLGDAYAKLIDGGNAVTNYNNALQADPKYAAANYGIGQIYESQKNPSQYVPAYEAAIAADPNYAPAYYRLYIHYYFHFDPEKCKQYLALYTQHADPSPLVDQAAADILFASQDYQGAINKAKALLPTTPDFYKPHYYKLMAYSYAPLGDFANAKTNIDAYLAHPDDSLTSRNYREAALIYYHGGFSKDSIFTFIRKAIALDTVQDNKALYIQLAANLSDSLRDPAQKAYWVGQAYLTNKDAGANELYNWGNALYSAADTLRAWDSAKTGISNQYYTRADSVFGIYNQKYPDYAVYGNYWRARSNWSLDTSMQQGLAIPYFEQMIKLANASKDSANFLGQVKIGYQYMIQYYLKVKKDYKTTLEYTNKYLELDPNNDSFKNLKAALDKYFAKQAAGGGGAGKTGK